MLAHVRGSSASPLFYPDVAKAEGAADARRPIRQAQGEAVVF
jgi:hypothetical protein